MAYPHDNPQMDVSSSGSARAHAATGPLRSLPLFRVFGIQIRLDWSWLIIFFVMVFFLQQYFRVALLGQPAWAVWLLSAGSVIGLFLCVLAHELGHSVVAMRHGIQLHDITLFIFGGMARLRGEPRSPGDELKIALAGPAVTVALATVFWVAWFGLGGMMNVFISEGVRYLAVINTVLLVFNMIPGFPLDGGRVLRAVLWKIRGNLLSATQTAAAVGRGFGVVLIVLGLLMMFSQSWGGLFYIFLGWFLASAANQSVGHLQVRQLLEIYRVADAAQRNVITVGGDTPLDQLVAEGFYRHHYQSFPVLCDSRFCGLICVHDVQRVLPDRWAATTVSQAMPPETASWFIGPEAGLYDAFRRMAEETLPRLTVTDTHGRVVGLLTRHDVMRFLQIHSGLNPAAAESLPMAIPIDEPAGPSSTRSAEPQQHSRRIHVDDTPVAAGRSNPRR